MSINCRSCHGQLDCLEYSSTPRCASIVFQLYQGVRSYVMWYLENMGLQEIFKHMFSKIWRPCATPKNGPNTFTDRKKFSPFQEVLNLRQGELVEVKSVEEIMATLDKTRRNKGLLWMTGMRKFCGGRYRVFKRVETILLESNGKLRKMKNTVLLQGVMCDGTDFCGCDRSCFHFWHEVWLRKVKEEA